MAIIKCKMCGGDIQLAEDKTFGTCEYCGSTMTFPKVSDDQRAAAFNRGNHFRRIGEFDKALAVYERIVAEDDTDAEAHWCCALCRFGIEYVEDPTTYEWLPTCHRASFDSFLEDVDYLAALEHSDGITRRQYQKDAAKIAEVQRGILATSQNTEPYDVFISYKELDAEGNRTRDSILAQEIYYQLTEKGWRVFFSRISLEDVPGTQYEPYIFAALNSARVMVVVGTSAENLNAVWVKNEWSRYLNLMRKDRSKLLLPCYRDMDPYDLPEQLSVLMSYDMGKIGFIQDLIRGIDKVLSADKPKETAAPAPAPVQQVVQQTVVQGGVNLDALLKRAMMFLEDGNFSGADEYCERVLDQDPENVQAYLGKLMADMHVRKQADLADCGQSFESNNNYRKLIRFGNEELTNSLKDCLRTINEHNEAVRKNGIYNNAFRAMNTASTEEAFRLAAERFRSIPGWKDADSLAEQCLERVEQRRLADENARMGKIYARAVSAMDEAKTEAAFLSAAKIFKTIPGFQNADNLAEQCLENAEKSKKRVAAVVSALKAGSRAKREPTLEEKLDASKKRLLSLRALRDGFDVLLAQESQLQQEQSGISAQETALFQQREKLGIFAGKEKKRIDEELYELAAKKRNIDEHISRNTEQRSGYSSITGIEEDIVRESAAASDLEAQLANERKNANVSYNYQDAVHAYLNDKVLSREVDAVYSTAVFLRVKYGDANSVQFGRYICSKNGGPEPIQWLVLAREGNRILLISKFALDCQPYNTQLADVTWESCTLRKWLNGSFLNKAFSAEEQAKIPNVTNSSDKRQKTSTTDRVFLLSITEASQYFRSDDSRICAPTEFAKAQGVAAHDSSRRKGGTCLWWLRSRGLNSHFASNVTYVGSPNDIGSEVNNSKMAVRPALWIDLG